MKLQLVSKGEESQLADTLSSLAKQLARIASEETERLAHDGLLPARQHEAVLLSLSLLRDIREQVALFSPRSLPPSELALKLGELSCQTSLLITDCSRSPQAARAVTTLARVVYCLNRAAERVNQVFSLNEPSSANQHAPGCRRILLPSNLLYLYHYLLFPPERMLVVAGTREDEENGLVLGAAFDVTLEDRASRTHVKADPEKLGRALHAMDDSGSRLSAWVHSHPGLGINSTFPSEIDKEQHQDWIAGFDATLLSMVMVENGYFRCFGTAIETGGIELCIEGKGVKKEEDFVYRLTQEE